MSWNTSTSDKEAPGYCILIFINIFKSGRLGKPTLPWAQLICTVCESREKELDICYGTSIMLLLVYIQILWELYKSPHGRGIETNSNSLSLPAGTAIGWWSLPTKRPPKTAAWPWVFHVGKLIQVHRLPLGALWLALLTLSGVPSSSPTYCRHIFLASGPHLIPSMLYLSVPRIHQVMSF